MDTMIETPNDEMQRDVAEEVADAMAEAGEKLREAMELLQGAERQAREAGLPHWLSGQLDRYTIGAIRNLITEDVDDQRYQSGNLPKMARELSRAMTGEEE
jgi:hypothetical protein